MLALPFMERPRPNLLQGSGYRPNHKNGTPVSQVDLFSSFEKVPQGSLKKIHREIIKIVTFPKSSPGEKLLRQKRVRVLLIRGQTEKWD